MGWWRRLCSWQQASYINIHLILREWVRKCFGNVFFWNMLCKHLEHPIIFVQRRAWNGGLIKNEHVGSMKLDPLNHRQTNSPNVHSGIHEGKPWHSLSSVYFTYMLSNTPLVHHSCYHKPYSASASLRVKSVAAKQPFAKATAFSSYHTRLDKPLYTTVLLSFGLKNLSRSTQTPAASVLQLSD